MNIETLAWIIGSGMATALGGVALLGLREEPTARTLAILLGFTAGVMLAATAFSLLVPALERGGLGEVLLGFGLGAATLVALDRFVPHVHPQRTDGASHRATLLLSALTIHNLPEGLAVGLAFAAGGTELGIPLALAIGIQNIPEGFAAAAPLVTTGVRRSRAVAMAAATGAVEPPAALIAFASVSVAASALPAALGFAAGAMLYVIADELIPESHGGGHERAATIALLAGFALMMTLDNAIG